MQNRVLVPVLALLAAALFILAYLPTFAWMIERFEGVDSYYGHGYLIPFIFAFLLYRKREAWLGQLGVFTRTGLIAFAAFLSAALALDFFGHLLTIFFLSGLSLPLALVGTGYLLFNPAGMNRLWFPFLFLLFMIPLPNEFLELISIPLKKVVSASAVTLVDAMGIPVILNGFEVNLRWGPLVVGNPCSGLRSLVSLLALASLVAHLSPLPLASRTGLMLLSLPIAVLCNIARVTLLIWHADQYGLATVAPGTWVHDGSGFALFAIALALLVSASKAMEKRWSSAN